MARKAVETPKPPKAPKKKPTHKHKEENHNMAPDRNGERRGMAALIAAGVVQIDSERIKDPKQVAKVSLGIADAIVELVESEENPEEHNGEDQDG